MLNITNEGPARKASTREGEGAGWKIKPSLNACYQIIKTMLHMTLTRVVIPTGLGKLEFTTV